MSQDKTRPLDDADNLEQTADSADQQPESSAADTQKLAEALAAAERQTKEYFDGWQRERADFANYKRRVEREISDIKDDARVNTLVALLPVLDDFELAVANLPEDLKGQPWLEGVLAIQRKFRKILDDHGVVAIEPTGEAFDPNLHEAIGMDASGEVESGHISETLQKGYAYGDKVLRPARVRVAE